MTHLILMYNIRPGQSEAEFETWVATRDVPTIKTRHAVANPEFFRGRVALGAGADTKPPSRYFEVVEVRDSGALGADMNSPEIQRIIAEFQAMVDTLVFVRAEKYAE